MLESQKPAVLTTKAKDFFVYFDEPTDWNKPIRLLRLSGWCVAANGEPLTAVRVKLGRRIFSGYFDRERRDVLDYLGMPAAQLWCGFTVNLRVPPGKVSFELQVAGLDSRWRKVAKRTIHGSWFSNELERQRWRELEVANAGSRYSFWFDRPIDWQRSVSVLYISGWCVDRSGGWTQGIRARVGSRVFEGNLGFARKDVAALYPELPMAGYSGFAIAFQPPEGESFLFLELQDADGQWRPFFSRKIFGCSDGSANTELMSDEEKAFFLPSAQRSPFVLCLDLPSSWKNLRRDLRITGWCLAGDPIQEMRARVGNKIFPVRHGVVRPDMALAFEGHPYALTSGFTADIRTPRVWSSFVLEARFRSSSWKTLFRRRIRGPFWRSSAIEEIGDYQEWIRLYDTITRSDREAILRHIKQLKIAPCFSILLPVHNTSPKWLQRAVESVRDQLYPNWELCVVDDASTDPSLWRTIQNYAKNDQRIKELKRTEQGHICAASNDALSMASGQFIALLDHDDELAPTALYFAALQLNERPDLQLLYSDEDKLDSHGRRCQPHFKPDWNPDLFTAQNYISHLGIYSTALVRQVGGFRSGVEGAQDYDLALRCIEKIGPEQIAHIPRVLYHWRMSGESTAAAAATVNKPYALDAAIKVVREHLVRTNVTATVEQNRQIYLRVKYPTPDVTPRVSIVIPTRDRIELLQNLLKSIFTKTEYPNYEVVVIDNESSNQETLKFLSDLQADDRVQIHRVAGPFNYSKLNNIGVSRAEGSVVVLMNNDLEVINGDWLGEMLSHVLRPGVGAVGARLWYPDGILQHGGVILGFGGVAGHIHGGTRADEGFFSRKQLIQDFSAVTAACMMVRRDVYLELNGLNEERLAVVFNDVDFCLRLSQAGYRIVWTPHAEFFHHESASRGIEDTSKKQRRLLSEERYMREKWGDRLLADPCYNPNLSLDHSLFTLAFPPRIEKPWAPNRHSTE